MRTFLAIFFCLLLPAVACAPFYPPQMPGEVADETALIVWDEKEKTEHFIRTARFHTEAERVGFVVPTPTQPTVTAIDNDVFAQLEQRVRPKRVYKNVRRWRLGSILSFFMFSAKSGVKGAPQGVTVLDQGEVAGQEYAVLTADDVNALAEWLKVNEFPFPESNHDWAQEYLDKNYCLTAFKYISQGEDGFSTEAVKMSFQTDKPFYPYREPDSVKPKEGRTLRVYLLADGPLRGATEQGPWAAELPFSARIDGLDQFRQKWLTCYLDRAEVRTGMTDLFFTPAEDIEEIRPPDEIVTVPQEAVIPIELLLIGAVLAVLLWRRRS